MRMNGLRTSRRTACPWWSAGLAAVLLGVTACSGPRPVPAAPAAAIPIWPGPAPGSEHWTQREQTLPTTPVGTVVLDVVTPTITPYLPAPGTATGAGVIIAPGGGFVALAIQREGEEPARWLQAHGIAAFVLKYRTLEKLGDGIPRMDPDTGARYGIADGIQALRVVRRHAAEWGLDPHRIGVLGFSAGGMVASGTVLQPDSAARPDFAAMIYGAPFGVMPPIPARLPPLFLAWARDDETAGDAMVRFDRALTEAGSPPETHIYRNGGHGFGLQTQGTGSDYWIEDFHHWLDAAGLTRTTP